MKAVLFVALLALFIPPALPAAAGPLPTRVGQCTDTAIAELSGRLGDTLGPDDGGDMVTYANDGVGVSYDQVPPLHRARVGDKVHLCLTSLPEDCPPDDDRGKTYKATDLRTGKSWELPDAEHMCGGA
jgi:hypothetical protein